MTRRNLYFSLAGVFIAIIFLSCTKEKDDKEIFYGHWKTSYGDTVSFYNQNGVNIAEFEEDAYNPGPPSSDAIHEYAYENNKLFIRGQIGASSSEPFRQLTTFKWINKEIEFQVQREDWFPFISSTGTVFTFTKIQ